MDRFRDWRFSTKLLTLLFVAAVVPLAIVSAVGYHRLRDASEQSAAALLGARADQLASELDGFHHAYLGIVLRAARLPAISAFLRSSRQADAPEALYLRQVLSSFVSSDTYIRALNVIDTNGHIVASSVGESVGADVSFRRYFKQSMQGATVVSDVLNSVVLPGSIPAIVYATPIRDTNSQATGVLALMIDANAFWSAARRADGRAGAGSYSVVYDRYGIRIAHSFLDEEIFHPAGPLSSQEIEELVAERRFGEDTRALLSSPIPMALEFDHARMPTGAIREEFRELFSSYAPGNHRENFVVARRLREAPWTVFFLLPREVARARSDALLKDTLAVSVVVIAIAMLVGVYFSRHIVHPLNALTRVTMAMAQGDRSQRAPIGTRDEIGLLAERINGMVDAIDQAQSTLETKVIERTTALADANEELSAQREELIAQREELRAQQTELLTKNREIEQATRLKSEFLANMSHELRTPLNSVIGFSELVLDEAGSSLSMTHQKYLNDVLSSGRHLLGLINDILDLSKIESGHMTLTVDTVSVTDAIEEALGLIEPSARKKRIAIERRIDGELHVRAESGKLRQVLLNLLSNAVKFSPDDAKIVVGAELADAHVRFYVRDQGPGIDDSLRDRLFEPFVQGENPLVKKHQGTGLGLAICKRLIELQGGQIEARRLDHGTELSFTLLVSTTRAAHTSVAPAAPEPVKAMPLLVIEDNDATAREIALFLSDAQYTPIIATSRDDVPAMVERHRPAAIVIDPHTSTDECLQLLHTLKQHPSTRKVPVILTNAPDATGYLAKPVERERLLQELAALRAAQTSPPIRTVLSIDDDARVGALLKAMLEPAGFSVTSAHNGPEGLALARREPFDLFIVDLIMPEMSGFEVVHELAHDERTRGRPIIVLTASDISQNERDLLKQHVRAIAEKGSVTKDELLDAIRRNVNNMLSGAKQTQVAERGKKVLVVDDHDLNRSLAKSLLERLGHQVLLAEDGQEGVDVARKELPDLILMDLAMPQKDGYTATRELKADASTAHIPIIALTALAMRGDENKAFEAGVNGYLTKPIERRALEEAVRQTLGSARH